MKGRSSRPETADERRAAGSDRAGFCLRLLPMALLTLLWTGSALAAGDGTHQGPDYLDFGWRVLNFAILAGLIYWLVADKAKAFFTDRRNGIAKALAEAEAAREAAQKTFQTYDAKLTKATGEIDEIRAMIEAQGRSEKERIVEEGRKTAAKMREDAQARMEQEFGEATQALRIEAVRLSTEMAEEIIRKNIRPEDHEAMVRDFIEKGMGRP